MIEIANQLQPAETDLSDSMRVGNSFECRKERTEKYLDQKYVRQQLWHLHNQGRLVEESRIPFKNVVTDRQGNVNDVTKDEMDHLHLLRMQGQDHQIEPKYDLDNLPTESDA